MECWMNALSPKTMLKFNMRWIQMPKFNSLTAEILVVKTIAPKILSEPCQQKTGSQVPGSRVQRFTVNKNPEP
jgi:hypothetical protein